MTDEENPTCSYGEAEECTLGGVCQKCPGPQDFRVSARDDMQPGYRGWKEFWVCSLHVQLYRSDPGVVVDSRDAILIREVERRLLEKRKLVTGFDGGELRIKSGTATGVGSGGTIMFGQQARGVGGLQAQEKGGKDGME